MKRKVLRNTFLLVSLEYKLIFNWTHRELDFDKKKSLRTQGDLACKKTFPSAAAFHSALKAFIFVENIVERTMDKERGGGGGGGGGGDDGRHPQV